MTDQEGRQHPRTADVHGGELKNGRLSQMKNVSRSKDNAPNEYLSHPDNDQEEE